MSGSVINAVLCAVIAITIPGMVAQPFLLYDPMDENEWMIELVDSGNLGFPEKTSIALDSNDYPHISYEDRIVHDTKYARWNGSAWIVKTIDTFSNGPNSIALDSKDYPHIVHTGHGLRYLWWNGTQWKGTTLDINEIEGYTQIVLDDQDNPHIAYVRNYDQLMYMYWEGSRWVSEIVASGDLIVNAQLALDDSGNSHIAFDLSHRAHYATRSGGNWTFEIVDPTTFIGSPDRIPIAVDSTGLPHICYRATWEGNLLYGRLDAGVWSIETVDTDHVGMVPSIVMDEKDYPRISYDGGSPRYQRFAEWTGNEWKIEDIDDDIFHDSALALDSKGNPHISYYRDDGGLFSVKINLYYATKTIQQQPSGLSLDIDPDTLNSKSEGRWITAYLRGENVEDIDASSLLLNDVISPAWWEVQNNTTLMAKFSRSFVQMILPVGDEVDVKVTGHWNDGQDFELHDMIRVIDPGPYVESPTSIYSRDESLGYSRSDRYVLASVRGPEEGSRVWLQ